jgi:hypothetical protein
MKNIYTGEDHIHTTSGTCMEISHIGHTTIYTPSKNIHLNNVLCVPKVTKNLVSIHHLAEDIYVFVKFHPVSFVSKIRKRRISFLKGNAAHVSTPYHHHQ